MISALRRSLVTLALCLPCLSPSLPAMPPTAAEAPHRSGCRFAARLQLQMEPREIELGDQGVLKLPRLRLHPARRGAGA